MFCSTVIPTIGRKTLSRAVESVLNQEFNADDFEIIVLNDSGKSIFEADWQQSERVQIFNTNRRNRSVARNTGAAVAKGEYLHFLDDDDWMLPGAFQNLWELAKKNKAAWLYGSFRLVNNEGDELVAIYPEEKGNCFLQVVAWEWLPLQASLVKSDAFFRVGGFASLPSLHGGFEDIDLTRKIAMYYDVAGTADLVANIRIGDVGSTTDYENLFIQNRQSRENALGMFGAFSRMRSSVSNSLPDSSYWYGRIVYYYIASFRRNIREKRLFSAVSRAIYAAVGFIISGRHIFHPHFWRGLLKPHIPRVRLAKEMTGIIDYSKTNWKQI